MQLPAGDGAGSRVERDRLLRELQARLVARVVIRGEQLVVRMRELWHGVVATDFAREDAPHPRAQFLRPPGLVEEREGEDAAAVADAHLQDGAALGPHLPFGDGDDFGHDGDVLIDLELGQCGQLAAFGVPARIVAEQVGDGAQAEGFE